MIPPTIPLEAPTVAVAGSLLVHTPLPPSVSVILCPTHTSDGPVMASGKGLTVTTTVAGQPVAIPVKVIVARPVATPPTMPVPPVTVAIPRLLLLQLPPPMAASLSTVIEPTHTLA